MNAPALILSGRGSIAGEPIFGTLEIALPAGKFSCLLGPSGVGKSTVLRLLAGLAPYVAFQGTIAASDGLPIAPRAVLMQQSDMLLPWADVLANITIGATLRGEKPDIAAALHLVQKTGLNGFERRLPATLSGGQRQRVALARSLMEAKPVVLLDEPFAALDPKSRRQMQELARKLLKNKTVLMVTHDAAEAARMADHVFIMTESAVASFTAPAQNTMAAQTSFAKRLAAALIGGPA